VTRVADSLHFANRAELNPMHRQSTILQRMVAIACLSCTGCATNPATGERQLSLVSEPQEIQMGRQAARQVQQTLGRIDDRDLHSYLRGVSARMQPGMLAKRVAS
jgi:predicted Zn-dependent protease